jgi:MSHA biogenesis protein MshO
MKATTAARPRHCALAPSHGGFALIEFVMALIAGSILLGSLAGLAPMIRENQASRARQAMDDKAQAAAAMVERSLRSAYPDSVRVAQSGAAIFVEFAPLKGHGRYRAGSADVPELAACPEDDASIANPSDPTANDRLSVSAEDSCFKTIGPFAPQGAAAGDWVSLPGSGATGFYGAGPATGGSKAMLTSLSAGATESRVGIEPLAFGADSSGRLFSLAGQPSTWVCDPASGNLSLYSGYGLAAAQPTSFPSPPSIAASGVASCSAALSGGRIQLSFALGDPAGARYPATVTVFAGGAP